MSGTWELFKTWTDDETLTNEDLNSSFLAVLDNAIASQTEGYSTLNNVPNNELMDSQVNPYPTGNRSYASTVAGELERLRFMLASITGNTEWWTAPATNIIAIQAALSAQGSTIPNQITSGLVSTTHQPTALIASSSVNSVTLQCTTTSLKATIGSTNYIFTQNNTLTGLTVAPGSNNTATVGANVSLDNVIGGFGTKLPMTSVGTSISGLVGQYAAFKVVHGASTEYFVAFVETASLLSRAFRGYFNDSSNAPIVPVTISTGDTITLMRLSYLFVKTDGTLDVTYNPLLYGSVAPSSPSSGDYWYDTANALWKKYNGTSFANASATLIGCCAQDTTKTIGSRTYEYFAVWDATNSIFAEVNASGSTLLGENWGQRISVAGNLFTFPKALAQWSTAGPFASGVTLSANNTYFLYITDQGEQILDTAVPYDRQDDLQGFYHPYAPWRAVGIIATSNTSTFFHPTMFGQPRRPPGLFPNTTGVSPIGLDGFGTSSTCGSFTTTSISAVQVTNFSVIVKTRGRPVLVTLQSGTIGISAGTCTVTLHVDGVAVAQSYSVVATSLPASAVSFLLWSIYSGDHTFALFVQSDNGANTTSVSGSFLVVKEL